MKLGGLPIKEEAWKHHVVEAHNTDGKNCSTLASQTAPHTGQGETKEAATPDWKVIGLISKKISIPGLTWAPQDEISASSCQNIKSLCRGTNKVQAYIPYRWSQQHSGLFRLHPWNGFHCGNSGQNMHSKDRVGGKEPLIAQVQLTGQMAVMSSQWPPPTSTPLFFGLWKSICGFEIDALVRWDYYYSSYWSRMLKTAWRVVTTFGFCGLFIIRQFVILLSRSTIIREEHLLCVFELSRKFKTSVIGPPKPQWLQTLLS